jgi:hypothetical protein
MRNGNKAMGANQASNNGIFAVIRSGKIVAASPIPSGAGGAQSGFT